MKIGIFEKIKDSLGIIGEDDGNQKDPEIDIKENIKEVVKNYVHAINKEFYKIEEWLKSIKISEDPFRFVLSLIVGLFFIWLFVFLYSHLYPISLLITLVLIGLCINYFFTYRKDQEKIRKTQKEKEEQEKKLLKEKERKKKEAFVEDQNKKGLFIFVDRNKKETWGTQKEIEKWKKEDDLERFKETLFGRVVESINKFKPSKHTQEEGYQNELLGYLKHDFPNAKSEVRTGESRPDLVIDDIAIEVKGSTYGNDIDTLTTKCLKYSKYYKNLIIVLFDPHFSPKYSEVFEGIKKFFPHVSIIEKPLE